MWGHTKQARRIVDATLVFDEKGLGEKLGIHIDSSRIDTPHSRFSNDRLWSLVKLLAEAIDNPDPSMQLFGDGIIAAISSQLFTMPDTIAHKNGGLAPWQLRRVIDYMEGYFPCRIELETLATSINLSQAHFSRAFKISTGLAPYQWQLKTRIQRAQSLLLHSNASLGEIAQATGFADTAHFGTTFRKLVGVPPGRWRWDGRR